MHLHRGVSAGLRAVCAGIAQLVERNLAKVEVAGSNPVVRSEGGFGRPLFDRGLGDVAEW